MAGEAGWQPDPSGRHEARYFDGTRFTEHVTDQGTPGVDDLAAPAGPPPPPPAPPSLRQTLSSTPAGRPGWTPPPARPTVVVRQTARWPYVLVGIVLAFGLLFGGCTVLTWTAGRSIDRAISSAKAAREAHTISPEQFNSVTVGTARETVIADLGKQPRESLATQRAMGANVCVTYYRQDANGDEYRFCFDVADKLVLKTVQ